MTKMLGGRFGIISAILLCVFYVGHRAYESHGDAALLREKTLEDAVAVVSPKPGALTETIRLPGNIVGWYEAPMYSR